ncbi:xanthine dehydrogenase accessory protein XdhC [Aureimonas altamirensis]|uniref:xanthine dehydrogenase accessory protein XdhC n=1 Tax=Aureimonas altamirensis TaxID=370622 RepID=UPI001E60F74B|nr:xanthine dehydrogenase accessory protein XdhC [Aureimonas altamirensis]UHD43991.1 xanthine dehydrogenase accessory protein XdhC [Aureimonas altamirensis]
MFVRVAIMRVRGSAPREAGTFMDVHADRLVGTIGGGQLEYMAIAEARRLLAAGGGALRMEVPLGPAIGQCCGGHVTLQLTVTEGEDAPAPNLPTVLIFGAGYVGRALARALSLLPVAFRVIDPRAEELSLLPAGIERVLTPIPEAEVRAATADTAYVILTHDHALDFLLAAEALGRGDAAYVGMIGSSTKRASFRSWLRRSVPGLSDTGLTCPIGAGFSRDKRPEVIAAFTAAELMGLFGPADMKEENHEDVAARTPA